MDSVGQVMADADRVAQRLAEAEKLLRSVQSHTLWEEAYDIRTLLLEAGETLAKHTK